jgi:hypothetical protein
MQNAQRPASAIERPTHDDPRFLAGKMQRRLLTEPHHDQENPRRGFELMKIARLVLMRRALQPR